MSNDRNTTKRQPFNNLLNIIDLLLKDVELSKACLANNQTANMGCILDRMQFALKKFHEVVSDKANANKG